MFDIALMRLKAIGSGMQLTDSSDSFGYWSKFNQQGGPQVLVHVSIYQGKPFWPRIFDPQPFLVDVNEHAAVVSVLMAITSSIHEQLNKAIQLARAP